MLGLAGGGIRGIPEPTARDEALDAEPTDAVALAVEASARLEASERPGATAETSAAMPAVSSAEPAITQRRVRLIRSSAASRASAARDCVWRMLIRWSLIFCPNYQGRLSALSKSSMRIPYIGAILS